MKAVPFRQDRERLVLQLLDERDTPWIAALLDELELAVGRPWRELLERIERLPARSSSARRAAVLHAMRGLLGGRERGPVSAKQVRRALFDAGTPSDPPPPDHVPGDLAQRVPLPSPASHAVATWNAHPGCLDLVDTFRCGARWRSPLYSSMVQPAGGPVNETGNYQLGKLLGRGGMGSVFEATHRFLGTSVAVKLLHPQLAEKPEVAQRFFREARAAVEIDHPNIVRVTDFGQARDGALYLVMELLTGRSLARAIATHRFTEAEAARVGAEVASGLEAAHARGIIHRDLKPDNIFLTATQVKVLDFGIAKVLDSLVTTTGGTLGTPLYMDPEQAKDASSCGPHSDIYALGVILFEMLTGRPPFLGDSVPAVLTKHLFAQPPRPSEFAPVSGRMEELVLACLEKDPQARPPSMGAVRLVLDELASGLDCATLLGGFPAPELLSALAATLPSPFHDTPPADSAAPSVVEQRASISASQAPGARSRIWLIGGALVVIAAASGVGWHLARDRGDEPSSSGRPAAIVAPAPPTAQHASADAGVPAVDAPHLATFVVRSRPDGALVSIAGVSVGKTPVSLSVPLPAELWVSLEGHEPLRHVATAPGDVSLTLQRRGRRPGGVGPRVQGTPETVPSERSPRTETLD